MACAQFWVYIAYREHNISVYTHTHTHTHTQHVSNIFIYIHRPCWRTHSLRGSTKKTKRRRLNCTVRLPRGLTMILRYTRSWRSFWLKTWRTSKKSRTAGWLQQRRWLRSSSFWPWRYIYIYMYIYIYIYIYIASTVFTTDFTTVFATFFYHRLTRLYYYLYYRLTRRNRHEPSRTITNHHISSPLLPLSLLQTSLFTTVFTTA